VLREEHLDLAQEIDFKKIKKQKQKKLLFRKK